jgi:DNA-binding MarR family transcriptional regulator
MTKDYDEILDSLNDSINAMSSDLRYNTGLELLYTGLLLNKYIDVRARKYNQNRSRLDIMHTLIAHGGVLKPSKLGEMTLRTKQTITKVIDGLERDGMVIRETTGEDRRTKKIMITQKGLDSIGESLPYTIDAMDTAMPSLKVEQMEELSMILKQIRKHLLSLKA